MSVDTSADRGSRGFIDMRSVDDGALTDRAVFHKLEAAAWQDPADAPPELAELAARAAAVGARRAQVTTGTLGFYTQLSEMPSGYEVPPHRHSAHELMVILDGGCQIHGGPELRAGDMAEVPADTEYGFTVGSNGLRFIVVRTAQSVTRLTQA